MTGHARFSGATLVFLSARTAAICCPSAPARWFCRPRSGVVVTAGHSGLEAPLTWPNTALDDLWRMPSSSIPVATGLVKIVNDPWWNLHRSVEPVLALWPAAKTGRLADPTEDEVAAIASRPRLEDGAHGRGHRDEWARRFLARAAGRTITPRSSRSRSSAAARSRWHAIPSAPGA